MTTRDVLRECIDVSTPPNKLRATGLHRCEGIIHQLQSTIDSFYRCRIIGPEEVDNLYKNPVFIQGYVFLKKL